MELVIVQFPGTNAEEVIAEGLNSIGQAVRWIKRNTTFEEERDGLVDIMQRLPDGTLTTEY
jgi:hypothetical protein